MPDILWISPVGSDRAVTDLTAILEEHRRPETNVHVTALDRGPHHLEYRYFEALVLPDILHRVKRAEVDGFDATVIGCFYDLGLHAGREISRSMPVVAPAEAATMIASTTSDRFSVIVGRDKWIPQMRSVISSYGFGDRLASFRSIDVGVLDLHDPASSTENKLISAAQKAVEVDGAEAIILGCTSEYGFYADLQREVGVPVIDSVIAPFKFSELLVDMAQLGWVHGNTGGYEPPPVADILDWGITDDYPDADVWTEEARTSGN